ncbi:hypothetical protein [Arenimonas sp. MALMAid1274]|uniref:hypothetical protein n=1 Tax=Arenimonas sp. MALMAid1274 TaxID=3411630 RepID=UPI003BA26C1F
MAILLAVSMIGCAQGPSRVEDDAVPPIEASQFALSAQCFDAWDRLLDEWLAQGGGVRATIAQTRAEIGSNGSRLADILREAWSVASTAEHGDLKVSVPGISFSNAARRHVPKDCAAYVWLVPLFNNRTDVFPAPVEASLLQQAPIASREDRPAMAQWVVTQLLAPGQPH